MKRVLTIFFHFFLFSALHGQDFEEIGFDDNPILTNEESTLLNSLLLASRDTFDFTGKKVAFFSGSNGSQQVNKSNYFNELVKPWVEKGDKPQISMVLLDFKEKKSTGYDVFVLSWVKLFRRKTFENHILRLTSKSKIETDGF